MTARGPCALFPLKALHDWEFSVSLIETKTQDWHDSVTQFGADDIFQLLALDISLKVFKNEIQGHVNV